MAQDRPIAAFVLALLATIIHMIIGIFFILGSAFFVAAFFPGLGTIFIVSVIVIIVLALWGTAWLYTFDETRATYGGVITVVVSVVALPTAWGFGIGSILGLIGGILGIVWKSSTATAVPTPPTPQPAPPPPAAETPATPAEEPMAPMPEEQEEE